MKWRFWQGNPDPTGGAPCYVCVKMKIPHIHPQGYWQIEKTRLVVVKAQPNMSQLHDFFYDFGPDLKVRVNP